jgi:hypothetical protein
VLLYIGPLKIDKPAINVTGSIMGKREKKTHLPGDTMYNCIDHVIYNKK